MTIIQDFMETVKLPVINLLRTEGNLCMRYRIVHNPSPGDTEYRRAIRVLGSRNDADQRENLSQGAGDDF